MASVRWPTRGSMPMRPSSGSVRERAAATGRYPVYFVDRLGLHLAGAPGNHVDPGGAVAPCALSREHGRAPAAPQRCAAPAKPGAQLVEGHWRISRGTAEPVRVLAAGAARPVLANHPAHQPVPPSPVDPAVDARDRVQPSGDLVVPA